VCVYDTLNGSVRDFLKTILFNMAKVMFKIKEHVSEIEVEWLNFPYF